VHTVNDGPTGHILHALVAIEVADNLHRRAAPGILQGKLTCQTSDRVTPRLDACEALALAVLTRRWLG
jgi:hypothetical protein